MKKGWELWSSLLRVIRRRKNLRAVARWLPVPVRSFVMRAVESVLSKFGPIDFSRSYEIHGHRLFLDPHMEHAQQVVAGVYERELVDLIQETLKPGMCMVDVGAHIGYYTLIACGAVGSHGTVFAFEPQEGVRPILERNISENAFEGICQIVPKAAFDGPGVRNLYVNIRDSGQSSVVSHRWGGIPQRVDTISLDQFFSELPTVKVDLVKIDVEGAEKFVLDGMRELSARNPNLVVILEYGLEMVQAAGYTVADLVEILKDLGFKTGYVLETGFERFSIDEGWPSIGYGNVYLTKG